MEYDAFGNEMTLDSVLEGGSGTIREVPFRFSTKYTDSETSLSYYGYRYYSAEMGRWPSRDPLEEEGFRMMQGMLTGEPLPEKDPRDRNPYAFVLNAPTNTYDYLGLQPALPPGWHGPGTDYDPAANPFDNSDGSWDCPMQCILKHVLGITVSSAAIASGQPLVPKRFVTPGSAEGTSIVGKMTDAVMGDLQIQRSRTIVGCCKIRYTKSASRFVSRWIPIIGWVQLTVDATKVSMCVCEECGDK
jgi:RHS repeat-associated protein